MENEDIKKIMHNFQFNNNLYIQNIVNPKYIREILI